MKLAQNVAVVLTMSLALACQPNDTPTYSFFDANVGPILQNSCTRAVDGCHVAQPDGTSLGNLDLTSYDSLMRRHDVLEPYGPYSTSLLLLKAGDPIDIQVETFDPDPMRHFVTVTTDIRHNAGGTVDLGSSGYALIKRWSEAGYTRTGVPDETLSVSSGDCRHGAPASYPGWDPTVDPTDSSFRDYVANVQPVMVRTCAGSSCHGSAIADLSLTCGESGPEARWNYFVSLAHVTSPASTSELLRRPLSSFRGGVFHEGGHIFASTDDPDYQVIRAWAEDIVTRAPGFIAPPAGISDGLRFFANRVQPVLVRKGCMFLNCHSPSMFHDLRLRGGAEGVFSRIATRHNYEISRLLLALDASDPNESRIIGKNLYAPEHVPGAPGIFHRGGSLLEDFGQNPDGSPHSATVADCAGVDADNGDLNQIPVYCVLARWHEIERQEAITNGEIFSDVVRAVFWVSRPTGVGGPRDFDTYRAGADLLRADANVDVTTGDLSIGAQASVLASCGLDPSTADIRGTAVSWDGARVAFGARSSASEPLRLYWMDNDGTNCERVPGVAPAMDQQDGILTHDFDPAFAPDGRLVFASTRGYLDAGIVGRAGPTRTPAAMQPNANLYVLEASAVRQLTFLLNQEMQPSFMTDGRVIFTTEKREPDFYQLAGRRENLDGGDYHPLFAQRGSVGFTSATEIVEMLDRNLAIVASTLDAADGAGSIAIVNRSIGPDQDDRDPADRFYVHSRRFPVPGALRGGTGVFRSPAALPTGRLLVACDQAATSLTSGGYDYQLCEMNPDSGAVRVLGGAAGRADVEPVPVFARAARPVFVSRIDEANAHTRIEPGAADATIQIVDFPLLATLLFSNTRVGRPIDFRIGGLNLYAEAPPPAGSTSFADAGGNVQTDAFGQLYVSRSLLTSAGLNADGSTIVQLPRGGTPFLIGVTDGLGSLLQFPDGAPFTGDMIQREQMQFYPGERSNQSFRRVLFNGMCAGCHGSITGRELDIAVNIDVLTSASHVMSNGY